MNSKDLAFATARINGIEEFITHFRNGIYSINIRLSECTLNFLPNCTLTIESNFASDEEFKKAFIEAFSKASISDNDEIIFLYDIKSFDVIAIGKLKKEYWIDLRESDLLSIKSFLDLVFSLRD